MIPAAVIADINSTPSAVTELELKIETLENELDDLRASQSPDAADFTRAIQAAFLKGNQDPVAVAMFFGALAPSPSTPLENRLARAAFCTSLSLHLLDTFFVSCCAYLPVFEPWHARLPLIHANLDSLSPEWRVAVAAFTAMGARASPHSALLGVLYNNIEEYPPTEDTVQAGVRREASCDAIQKHTHELATRLDIASESNIPNLEALMVQMQMSMFEELVPKRSKSALRLALGQFKDVLDSALPAAQKTGLVQSMGLPLFLADSVIAAYGRKPPLIVDEDFTTYFRGVNLSHAEFGKGNLAFLLDAYVPRGVTAGTVIDHQHLIKATTMLACWLAFCQRDFAYIATHRAQPVPIECASIYRLWSVLDQIHEGARRIQELLVNLHQAPKGCSSDGCSDLHLRFDTRLDRDLMDVTHLLHVFIEARLSEPLTFAHDLETAMIRVESERRVRKSLKLIAFYSRLYITSQDKHMCYHLTWQLELLPNWTELVVQRYGEMPGPATPELEVTEMELDWYRSGLKVAAFFHPVAERRLSELEGWRRPPRPENGF